MTPITVTVVFAAVVAVSMIGGWIGATRTPTIHSFFWSNQRLSSQFGTSLLLSGSFSLNGLLYQSWLGYSIGWWSLIIQVVWCFGYVVLALQTPKFRDLLKTGTLHGIIGRFFGETAGRVASIASLLGFAIMIGWETSVGATILQGVSSGYDSFSISLAIFMAMTAGLYTCVGGLRGNAIVNFGHNIFKASILIIVCAFMIFSTSEGPSLLITAPSATLSLSKALESLGGIAVISNLIFSAMWQACDMSNWQDISSIRDTRGRRGRAIIWSSLLVFLFPGLIGSLLGITLSAQSLGTLSVTDSNILNAIISQVEHSPVLGLAFLAACGAAMLSTIDGLALSAAQTLAWDLTSRRSVALLLPLGPDRPAEERDDSVVAISRVGILGVCAAGACLTSWLVNQLSIELFDIVYVAVIAQMSLSGPVLFAVYLGNRDFLKKNGWLAILLPLLLGYGFCIMGEALHMEWMYTFAPVATIVISVMLAFSLPTSQTVNSAISR